MKYNNFLKEEVRLDFIKKVREIEGSSCKKVTEGRNREIYDYGNFLLKKEKLNEEEINKKEFNIALELTRLDFKGIPLFFAIDMNNNLYVEYVDGKTVKELHSLNALNEETICKIYKSIFDLYSISYNHKDLHEDNIIVNSQGEVRFIDLDDFYLMDYLEGYCIDNALCPPDFLYGIKSDITDYWLELFYIKAIEYGIPKNKIYKGVLI